MMQFDLADLCARLADQDAVLVRVEATKGSAPREAGTCMLVFADDVAGTIGGGQLEHRAIAQARLMLLAARAEVAPSVARHALGPNLGQCCGGAVTLRHERLGAADAPRLAALLSRPLSPVALFGGGHVGRAIVQALAPLPYAVTWIDSRDEIFPAATPPQVRCEHSDPVQAAVADLAPGSQVLVMSFSHAEDLDIIAACLRRQRERADLPFIGLIGSKTKWATFRRRLAQRGFSESELARVTCPIGLPGIGGKEPQVIAVGVAAQLLMLRGDSQSEKPDALACA